MIKVKVIYGKVEEEVNQWISENFDYSKIFDIKYSTGVDSDDCFSDAAMIIYEEKISEEAVSESSTQKDSRRIT